ncbi:hypothetical protein PDESU_05858 [Pontiella desulfatans]|uniref:Uncharacterized protein n=1 Tax=Pontiella desulfatans TaxID=2750659 RepID=A0A6C2UAU7_PONDE|nr:hypothetical protein [Pontiella desulfatans]VGO17262.1 hypothetical protein PDESU_05858 [Pontiella desulfatans]
MRGHIIAEERFLHQGIDHHLFVTASDGAQNEYRFEVRRTAPGSGHPETIFEKTEDLSTLLGQCPNTTIDQLIEAELRAIRVAVTAEEDLHANDP